MDVKSLLGASSIVTADRTGLKTQAPAKSNSMFDKILNSAIDNINNTNNLLSDAENAEISFAMGETESTHDLMIALQKASTALQYTVAVRDKFMEAYKEIMNMQI
ncbi:MAG: flagellar hook-basal body complex protein FliE [Lachnospiraceae bacterium]|nr:flagellar hook-basal body complex protein FliE [Lachnospiraceae bacterium]